MRAKGVSLLDEAREDLKRGEVFYESQEEGIGTYFIDSLLSDIASLPLYAGTHRKKYGSYYLKSKRFPFAIYYDLTDEIAIVIAVLDMRMNPKSIRSLLRQRKRD